MKWNVNIERCLLTGEKCEYWDVLNDWSAMWILRCADWLREMWILRCAYWLKRNVNIEVCLLTKVKYE